MSNLMIDFPLSKEDPPEVLAHYVLQHYKDTRDIIDYSHIPPKVNAPLKIARKKSKQNESDEEDLEEKPKKK